MVMERGIRLSEMGANYSKLLALLGARGGRGPGWTWIRTPVHRRLREAVLFEG
jgi:hypothetical protein